MKNWYEQSGVFHEPYELSMIFHFHPVNFMALSIHQDSWDLWEGPGETLAGSSLDPQCKDL